MPTYTQAQYNALSQAISQGATRVKYADKEVEYRTLDEMLRLQKIMENDLWPNNSSTPKNTRFYGSYSKGIQ